MQRHHFETKVPIVKTMFFFSSSHVQMWELDHKEGWEAKNWCFQSVLLEKIWESLAARRSNQPMLLLSHFSRVWLCTTPQMAAHQVPPSLGFSRQEHWSGLPLPSPMHESEKCKWSRSVVSDPQRPHGLQPSRLLRPWDFPSKSTGVGCHCLLRANVKGNQYWLHWKDWCWSWSSNTSATWCEELTHWKRPGCWERLRPRGKRTTENQIVGWHYQNNRSEFEQTLGGSEGQGSLACSSPWGCKELDMT